MNSLQYMGILMDDEYGCYNILKDGLLKVNEKAHPDCQYRLNGYNYLIDDFGRSEPTPLG